MENQNYLEEIVKGQNELIKSLSDRVNKLESEAGLDKPKKPEPATDAEVNEVINNIGLNF